MTAPPVRLTLNTAYTLWNCAWGVALHSWWFVTLGCCCAVTTAARMSVLYIRRSAKNDPQKERITGRTTGILLLTLAFCMIGINVLSGIEDRGTVFSEITMITIAVYTLTKVTFAIIGLARARRDPSQAVRSLRSLSFAEAFCSVYTLQRSMLVSFPGMLPEDIRLMNLLTGTAVWLLLMLMGLHLTGGRIIRMTEKKMEKGVVNGYKKIEKGVVEGYKKVEDGVVGGYKKIEKGAIEGYTKIEDRFVDAYLKKEGESLEEAKKRLKG